MRRIIFPLVLLLGACSSGVEQDAPSRLATNATPSLPPAKSFGTPDPVAPKRSNRDIARDFLQLSFELESGRELSTFSRFEGPISVRLTGSPPPSLSRDLNSLLSRLRREAGITIERSSGTSANITIEAVSRAQIRRQLPKAACFVVPNVDRLADYRKARGTRATNWSLIKQREKIAIFVPNDVSPQEVRDCLHEELAQALGPLNDLYRLSDSVFNDDNVHTVLTGFDMLVLRAYYSPQLRSGMTKTEVAARLPAILARLNPAGERFASRPLAETPRAWVNAVQNALGPGTRFRQRIEAGNAALRIAKNQGWSDHRLAFSHFIMGRLTQAGEPELARNHFLLAERFYRQAPGTALHQAYSASQLAAYAVNEGDGVKALSILGPHLATAQRYENAALLATLLLLRAEALELTGRVAEAQTIRLDSVGWARYGFGDDWAVRAKASEISSQRQKAATNG
ncbi:MAG: DUF2927 domain-containing protein [Pseudomonadota bacterium]